MPALAAGLARVVADIVIIEVAGELRGELFLPQPLEPAPRGLAAFLPALLGEVQVLVHLVEVDVGLFDRRLIDFLALKFLGFGFFRSWPTQPCSDWPLGFWRSRITGSTGPDKFSVDQLIHLENGQEHCKKRCP